jgi:hypothetical protein
MSSSNLPSASATSGSRDDNAQTEEGLRNQLRTAMQNLKRREPLDPTYKRLLMNGIVSSRRPVLPKDKVYKRIGSDLRHRVETFMQQTEGKDPWDRIAQRQPLEEEQMRAALTLREAKIHEQKALVDVTLAALPKRNGMDAAERRRHLEGIALGLQSVKKPIPKRSKTPPLTAAQQTEMARQQAELERQKAQARAREDARKHREEEDRKQREEEMKRKGKAVETPQQTHHKIYQPIFQKLWDMEFPQLGGTNPFRIVIDRENCASVGAPDYFDVIETPMNLTYIQQKVDALEYPTISAFFKDVDLMINNAILYNSDPSNPYRIAAEEMLKRYKRMAKKVVKQYGPKR